MVGSLLRTDVEYCKCVNDNVLKTIGREIKGLTKLRMKECNVTDDGFEALLIGQNGMSEVGKSLLSLDISECFNITDETMHYIGENCTSLQSLDLNASGYQVRSNAEKDITESGLIYLLESCTKLKTVYVEGRLHVTDEVIEAIKECKNLETICVYNCKSLKRYQRLATRREAIPVNGISKILED